MLVRIGHLECRYRLPPNHTASGEAISELEQWQPQLWQAVAGRLEQTLKNDPTVYILRNVDSRLSIGSLAAIHEEQPADLWVSRLATQVLDHLHAGGDNLQRFEDQADYVAQFLVDLLTGSAWEKWYYGAFQDVLKLPLRQAVLKVLQKNHSYLESILTGVHRRGMLEKLFEHIQSSDLAKLGFSHISTPRDSYPARTFFYFASQFASRLELWGQHPPGQEILDEYMQMNLPSVDWLDRRGLAEALLSLLRFFGEHGFLVHTISSGFSARLEMALDDLDWLDTDYLQTMIPSLLETRVSPELPLPRHHTSQEASSLSISRLLDDLIIVLARYGDQLDRGDPASHANRLRMMSWLAAMDPGWMNNPQVRMLVENVHHAWAALASLEEPLTALRRLQNGNSEIPLPELKPVIGLGQQGVTILQGLLGADLAVVAPSLLTGASSIVAIPSPSAGVSLLLRVLLDTRLLTLADYLPLKAIHPDLTPRETLLLGLLLCWAGAEGVKEGRIDPGLTLLAGLPPDRPPLGYDDFDRACVLLEESGALGWSSNAFWLGLLSSQSMLDGATFHLYRLQAGEDSMLLAVDGSGLCVLGQMETSDRTALELIQDWLTDWTLACGLEPQIVCNAELRELFPVAVQAVVVVPGANEALAFDHQRLGQDVISGLQTLSVGAHALSLTIVALAGLRLWSRWLGRFGGSSADYVLKNFVRRPGRFYLEPGRMRVELDSLPLDMVLQMAGYTAPLGSVPWLKDRRLEFIL